MEKLEYKFSKAAFSDLRETTNFYENNQNGLGARFIQSLRASLETLQFNPKIGRYGKVVNTREFVLQEFPFVIVYRIKNKLLEILRVMHQSRRYP